MALLSTVSVAPYVPLLNLSAAGVAVHWGGLSFMRRGEGAQIEGGKGQYHSGDLSLPF